MGGEPEHGGLPFHCADREEEHLTGGHRVAGTSAAAPPPPTRRRRRRRSRPGRASGSNRRARRPSPPRPTARRAAALVLENTVLRSGPSDLPDRQTGCGGSMPSCWYMAHEVVQLFPAFLDAPVDDSGHRHPGELHGPVRAEPRRARRQCACRSPGSARRPVSPSETACVISTRRFGKAERKLRTNGLKPSWARNRPRRQPMRHGVGGVELVDRRLVAGIPDTLEPAAQDLRTGTRAWGASFGKFLKDATPRS